MSRGWSRFILAAGAVMAVTGSAPPSRAQQTLYHQDWDHAFTFPGAGDGYLGFIPSSLALGDMNLDGAIDIVVAGYYWDVPVGPRPHAGVVNILFGPFLRGQCWDLNERPADVRIYGAASDAGLGYALAIGDLTGDSVPDLLLGAPVPLIFSPADMAAVVPGPFSSGQEIDLASASGVARILPAGSTDQIGSAVVIADVGGSSALDAIVLAPRATNPAQAGAMTGAAYVFFGPVAPGATFDLSSQAADVTIYGEDDLRAISTGDLDDDGQRDLLLGAYRYSASGFDRAGRAYGLFGRFTAGTVIDLLIDAPDVRVDSDLFDYETGILAIAGDVSGDGRDDLVVGSPVKNFASYVDLYLGPRRRGDRLLVQASDRTFQAFGACTGEDGLGYTAAIGDVTGDGANDLVLGMAGACRRDSGLLTGGLFIVRGPIVAGPPIDLTRNLADFEVYGSERSASLASSIAIGDLSGDGADDIAAGEGGWGRYHEPIRFAGAISGLFGGPGLACLPRPAAVAGLRLVRRGGDIEMSWDTATDVNTDTYTVWKVETELSADIPCANSAADGLNVTASCRAVARLSPVCTAVGAVAAAPALAFYQVRGFCADATEGLNHPY